MALELPPRPDKMKAAGIGVLGAQANVYDDGTPVDPLKQFAVLATDPLTGNATGLMGTNGNQFLIESSAAPNNGDGRPDGTIYIQTV